MTDHRGTLRATILRVNASMRSPFGPLKRQIRRDRAWTPRSRTTILSAPSLHAMSPLVAEFLGTALLIILGHGVVATVVLSRTKGNTSGWIVITTGWAFAVTI